MGVNGQAGMDMLALQKVLRNIVKMFMEGKLEYKPIRTVTLPRDHTVDVERLRTTRRESQRLPPARRLGVAIEEVNVT